MSGLEEQKSSLEKQSNTDFSSQEVLINAMKYLIDTLLNKEAQLTRLEQLQIKELESKLENIKSTFIKYNLFIKENNKIIQELLKIQGYSKNIDFSILLVNDVINKNINKLIETIRYMSSFFTLNNFDNNNFDNILEKFQTKKTKEEKIEYLLSEVNNINNFIENINISFNIFNKIETDIYRSISKLQMNLTDRINTEDNNYYFLDDNIFLSIMLNDLYYKIPKKDSYSQINFIKLLINLSKNVDINDIKDDFLISKSVYEILKSIYEIFSKLYLSHSQIENRIINIKDEIINIGSTTSLLLPKNKVNNDNKIRFFISGEEKFDSILENIFYKQIDIFRDIKIKNKTKENIKIKNIKKEIFVNLLEIFELLKIITDKEQEQILSYLIKNQDTNNFENIENENIKSILNIFYKIIEKSEEIKKLEDNNPSQENNTLTIGEKIDGKKDTSSIEIVKTRKTFHFEPNSGGSIEKLIEIETPILQVKTIGETAQEIREMINSNFKKSRYTNILSTFPGREGSLEGNYIIVGPWGGGKTALLKELSQDDRIITINVLKSHIIDQWYGNTEKNIKQIYDLASKLQEKYKKNIYIFFDEVDNLFTPTGLSGGGGPNIQKELQNMLDGVHSYSGIHVVMLSNVPHKIPVDIYRRMEKTFVLKSLNLQEKVELIKERLSGYPFAEDFIDFLGKLNLDNGSFRNINNNIIENKIDEEFNNGNLEAIRKLSSKDDLNILDLYIEEVLQITDKKEKDIMKKILGLTPKLLYQVTEKVFDIFLHKFNSKQKETIEKRIGELQGNISKKEILKIFKRYNLKIELKDFLEAVDFIFTNASTIPEIEGNFRFYTEVNDMLKRISSSAFEK